MDQSADLSILQEKVEYHREDWGKSHPVSAPEWRWVLGYSLLLILISSLPYILGLKIQGAAWDFSGGVVGIEDVNAYLANMVSGSYGNWLFRTPYSVELQSDSLFFLHYIWLGKLVSPPDLHLKVVILYHLFRAISVLLVCLATYDLIAFFIPEVVLRRWGLLIATIGGGAGWLILVLRLQDWLATLPRSDLPGLNLPLEFYSPETFGFLALFAIPHVSLARAGLLWGIKLYLKACSSVGGGEFPWLMGVQTGLVWLLTLLAQPLTGMLSGVVAGLFLFAFGVKKLVTQLNGNPVRWHNYFRTIGLTVWAGVFAIPLVVYYFLVFQFDPVLRSWQIQSPLPSPHPIVYLFAYGLFIPFAVIGIGKKIHLTKWLLPISWVLAALFLAYAPFNMQRRLVDGVWVALIILAIASLSPKVGSNSRINKKLGQLFKIAGVLSMISAFLLLVGATNAVQHPGKPIYIPGDQVNVMENLAQIAQPGEVVLSAVGSGNVLPTYAPVRVVIGIGTLTANFRNVEKQVQEFFSARTPDQIREKMLHDWQVDYIFWGPEERELGTWNPNQEDFLELLFESGEYRLYRLR